MNPFFEEMQAVADELITEFGQTGKVTRYTAPSGSEGGEPSEDVYPAKMFPDSYQAREIDGTVVLVGDVKLYISAIGLPITPKPGDVATVNGKDHRIINSDPNLYDGITQVAHIVQARTA